MKKMFKKLTAFICSVLVVTFLAGSTVFCGGTDTSVFDFGQTVLSIRQGESASISLYAYKNYTYYVRNNSSKKTYCECSGNSGSSTITFHVGDDETAGKTVDFWFYIEGSGSDQHDLVQVRVVQGTSSAASSTGIISGSTQAIASAIPQVASTTIAFTSGGTGIVSVTGNYIGLVSDSNNTPLAAFSISNKKGQMAMMQLQNIVTANSISYIGVYTPLATNNLVINISDTEKAAMMARGIAGLYINQQYILW